LEAADTVDSRYPAGEPVVGQVEDAEGGQVSDGAGDGARQPEPREAELRHSPCCSVVLIGVVSARHALPLAEAGARVPAAQRSPWIANGALELEQRERVRFRAGVGVRGRRAADGVRDTAKEQRQEEERLCKHVEVHGLFTETT
jgi:hypothetical protein